MAIWIEKGRVAALFLFLSVLSACGAQSVWAPDDLVAAKRYTHPGPASLTLITVMNAGSHNGAHSALLINGSERVLFDPAGSFAHETIPERNDVIYGMNPAVLNFYLDYHTRSTYYTIVQEIEIPRAMANDILRRAQMVGPVAQANCARSVGQLLRETPPINGVDFSSIGTTWFPDRLMERFDMLSGVEKHIHQDDDANDNTAVLRAWRG